MTASKLFRVESFVAGLAMKAPCRAATTVPIDLSGLQTINTHVGQEGDRILVKDQVDPIENGVYTMEVSAWRRDGDFDGSRDVVGGTIVPAWDAVSGQMVQYQVNGEPAKVTPDVDSVTFSIWAGAAGSSSETDTLQSVTDRGETTTNDIEILAGSSLIIRNLDDSVHNTFRTNDFEQPFPFLEIYGTSPDVEAVRFNYPAWSTGSAFHISGGGTRRYAFYGYGDAISGSISQDLSGNIRITAVGGNLEFQGGDFDMRDSAVMDFTVKHQSVSSSSGTLTIPYADGQSFNVTLTENVTTLSLTDLPIATGNLLQYEGEINQDGASAYTITWPASFEFAGGTEPDFSTLGSKHLVHFRSRDDGTTWLLTHVAEFS